MLMQKNQNMQADARMDHHYSLSASSSNPALSSLNNTLNNYQMLNYSQQSQKTILNQGYLFASHHQQPSIPQKKRLIPARDANSQSALSLTQHPDQEQTHTQSTNQKEATQDEFNKVAAEKDRYQLANSSSKFKHPAAKNAHQGSARIRNSSYNSRQGKNSTSSGPRIYSANNFLKN